MAPEARYRKRSCLAYVKRPAILAFSVLVLLAFGWPAAAENSSWSVDKQLSVSMANTQSGPRITALPNGSAMVSFHYTPDGTDYDVQAQLIDPNGDPVWAADRTVHPASTARQQNHDIASNSTGHVMVVWLDTSACGGCYEVVAQVIKPDGTNLWSNPVVVAQGGSIGQFNPRVVASGNDWVVVWNEARTGNGGAEVWAGKLDAAGAPVWCCTDIQVSAPSTSNHARPDVAVDAAGNAFIAWNNGTGGNVHSQLLTSSGTAVWASGDVVVHQVTTDTQEYPAVVAEVGRYIAVWSDHRLGTSYHTFGQALGPTGLPLWGVSDKRMSIDSSNDYTLPTLDLDTTARAGELMVAWQICTGGCATYDISMQRADANGDRQWLNDLAVNQVTTDSQDEPSLAYSSTLQRTYVAWSDRRSGSLYDVFGQLVTEQGSIPESGATWIVVALMVALFVSIPLVSVGRLKRRDWRARYADS